MAQEDIMPRKVVLFAFNGEPMCFVHVLLNALDMEEKGFNVKIVLEGNTPKTANALNDPKAKFHKVYQAVKEKNLIDCVCRACSAQVDALEGIREQGLPLCDEMTGHPSIARYLTEGYQVITF
jgi:hypothetical protein